jgi:protein-S-isoprenylcysteine O-methyltransferase Ste14
MLGEPFRVLVVTLAIVTFTAFAWSIVGVFRNDGQRSAGYTALRLACVSAWVIFVYSLMTSPRVRGNLAGWSAVGYLLAAQAGFWHTAWHTRRRKLTLAFSDDPPQMLYRAGLYRYVRHPFYSSYLLAYLGALVAAPGLLAAAAFVTIILLYFRAARVEERKFANSTLAAEYDNYRKNTGMFVPKLSRLWHASGGRA